MEGSTVVNVHKKIAEELCNYDIPGIEVLEGYRSGSVIVSHGDYAYVINYRRNNAIYMKCRIRECNATSSIMLKESGPSDVQDRNEHLHPPDTEYISTIKFRSELRKESRKRPTRGCREVFNQVSSRKPKVNEAQQKILVSFMEFYPNLTSGLYSDKQSRIKNRMLWADLTDELNQAGPAKPVEKWRLVWKSWRNKIRRKRAILENQDQKFDSSMLFRRMQHLTDLEERVLAIKGTYLQDNNDSEVRSEMEDDDDEEEYEEDEGERSFRELINAVNTIDEPEPSGNGRLVESTQVLHSVVTDDGLQYETIVIPANSTDYDGVIGEEVIVEVPSQSADSENVESIRMKREVSPDWQQPSEEEEDEPQNEDVHENHYASRNPDILSRLTDSVDRMENTIRNMDSSLKDLIVAVKTLVQLQQKQM